MAELSRRVAQQSADAAGSMEGSGVDGLDGGKPLEEGG
jgi:hypothetical protein